jgi:hypothetical protein
VNNAHFQSQKMFRKDSRLLWRHCYIATPEGVDKC